MISESYQYATLNKMNVWLLTIGEPVPTNKDFKDRLHRAGYFARFLADYGHDVTWWTSTFDHFRKKHNFNFDTTIKLDENLKINLLFGGGYKSNVSLGRFIDHVKIAKKFDGKARLEKQKPDIIVCSLPTIELCSVASKFGTQFNIPVLLDMRDMWPDIFVDTSPSLFKPVAKIALLPLFKLAKKACAGATAITGVTEAFVDWGVKRAGRKRHELDRAFYLGYSVLEPDEEQIEAADKFWDEQGILSHSKSFNICFIGAIGRQFDFDTIIAVAKDIEKQKLPIKFVLCGSGDRLEYLTSICANQDNIIFPGWIDSSQIHNLMRRSAIGLNPLVDRYDFRSHINNKAIEYMSASLPIFTTLTKGVLPDLLRKNNCGMCYPIGDHRALLDIIMKLYNDRSLLSTMRKNAFQLFTDCFDANIVYKDMMEHLIKIINYYSEQNKFVKVNDI